MSTTSEQIEVLETIRSRLAEATGLDPDALDVTTLLSALIVERNHLLEQLKEAPGRKAELNPLGWTTREKDALEAELRRAARFGIKDGQHWNVAHFCLSWAAKNPPS